MTVYSLVTRIHLFVSLMARNGATESAVRDTANGKSR